MGGSPMAVALRKAKGHGRDAHATNAMKPFFVPILLACVSPALADKAITVAPSGADFKTVQAAVDSVPADNKERVVIHIQPGTYKERIIIPREKPMITFLGEGSDPSKTILTYDWSANSVGPDGKKVGTSGSCSTLVSGSDFSAENVTFENSAGDVGQAVAIKFNSDRGTFRNCRFIGWQDTLYIHDRRAYFKDCYIEGRTDFIFGKSTAVFENCTIHSKNGGYVTAAATPEEVPFGFVFLRCKLTGEGAPALLGRPWRPCAAVAFVECELGARIKPEGWQHWNDNPQKGKPETARYSEYKSTGPGAKREARVDWSHQLSEEEAKRYTIENILGGEDHWNPAAPTH
jgi:pectinesterase